MVDDIVVVFTGGDPLPASVRVDIPANAFVVAADSGVEHAQAAGVQVDLAVGDFDSVHPDALAAITAAGARIERHPEAKNQTDLELALGVALRLSPRRVVVIGGAGGRLDHFLANALVLGAPEWRDMEVEAWMGPAVVYAVHTKRELTGIPDELVTLIAGHGPVTGVTTEGLRWPLREATLLPGSTLGVSNRLVASRGSVSVATGALLVIQPEHRGPAVPLLEPNNGDHP